jgi:hypothetical protein
MQKKRGTRALTLNINAKFLEKSKRSQTTIFIILGIAIVAVVLFIFIIKGDVIKRYFGDKSSSSGALSQFENEVKIEVESCLENSLKSVLFINALQGGYYKAPLEVSNNQQDLDFSSYIHYYLAYGRIFMPSKKELAEQISVGVKDQAIACLNFSNSTYDLDYSFNNFDVAPLISDDNVKVSVNFPITLSFEGSNSLMKDFSAEVQTEYLKFYLLAGELSEEQTFHLGSFCVSCADSLSKKYGMKVTTDEFYEEQDYVLIYYLEKERYDDDPVRAYSFAHKFEAEVI